MKNEKVLTLVEGAVMVALATVLSFVKIFHLPWADQSLCCRCYR